MTLTRLQVEQEPRSIRFGALLRVTWIPTPGELDLLFVVIPRPFCTSSCLAPRDLECLTCTVPFPADVDQDLYWGISSHALGKLLPCSR